MRPLDILSITLVICATALVLALPLGSDDGGAMARRGHAADDSVLHYPHYDIPDAANFGADAGQDLLANRHGESAKRGDRHLFSLDDSSRQEIGDALYSGTAGQEGSRTTELRYTLSDRVYRL